MHDHQNAAQQTAQSPVSKPGNSNPFSSTLYLGHPALPGHAKLAPETREREQNETPEPNDPKVRPPHLPGYELVPELSDEFDGDVLDATKWSTQRSVVKWPGVGHLTFTHTHPRSDFTLSFSQLTDHFDVGVTLVLAPQLTCTVSANSILIFTSLLASPFYY